MNPPWEQIPEDYFRGIGSPVQDELPRLVRHYQYFSWPDHGVPNEPGGVLSFLEQVNRAQRSIPGSGPIVVHCRYGAAGWAWNYPSFSVFHPNLGDKNTSGKSQPFSREEQPLVWS